MNFLGRLALMRAMKRYSLKDMMMAAALVAAFAFVFSLTIPFRSPPGAATFDVASVRPR